ncbi:LOW QUALITY PROTEIN: FAU ubiquitin-like and ribosomal protein S30 [Athalia rosae]|uniref:LOW QUALITY PROTEIN: FAU ubiquitin-like and ribosomal protein S30 n=1 Tax=Athalia rosae TaxID=37344 RepID=UPI00203340FC|nr:LOW QUALITY PROTEIN: FAU ubiquitin-like and ribosomal protein S30 [Athalia rosae]
MMQLHIRGQQSHILDCNGDETVAQIKAQIAALENVDASELSLSCGGAPLTDDFAVAELTSFSLDLTVPMLGGKVHGSLARAGKVKGQTPKVEKQEKKRRRLVVRRGEFSTTDDSLMSFKPSVVVVDRTPTPTRKKL